MLPSAGYWQFGVLGKRLWKILFFVPQTTEARHTCHFWNYNTSLTLFLIWSRYDSSIGQCWPGRVREKKKRKTNVCCPLLFKFLSIFPSFHFLLLNLKKRHNELVCLFRHSFTHIVEHSVLNSMHEYKPSHVPTNHAACRWLGHQTDQCDKEREFQGKIYENLS